MHSSKLVKSDSKIITTLSAEDETTYCECSNFQGGDSQNFLRKFVRFFETLGLKKVLRLVRLKVLFEADIIKA